MAIYSLHHQPIGKATQARPHTSAAHVRYITRPSAASHIEAGRMPVKPREAAAFMVDAEDGDRKNARVSDKLMLALPRELDAPQRAELVRGFAEEVTEGRAPWLAAHHDQGKDALNPHCHLLIRDRDPATGKRVAGLSEIGSTNRLRALWEEHANRALERAGRPERIDRRTLEAQGIARAPTVHEGPKSQQMERRGARPESRSRRYRNRPGSRLPHRQVDYHGIDKGRSRPAYNRDVRETPADYWRAMDEDNQARELDQLRAIHHRPDLVIVPLVGRAVSHGDIDQHGVDSGVLLGGFSGVLLPPASSVFLMSLPTGLKPAADRVLGREGYKKTTDSFGKPIDSGSNNSHVSGIMGNEILSGKGVQMSIDDRDKALRESDLAEWRAKEGKSRAALDNAMDAAYHFPKSSGKRIGKLYDKGGLEALNKAFHEYPHGGQFGIRPGSLVKKEGYQKGAAEKRQAAAPARRDVPSLWDRHAQDKKHLDAAERSYAEKFGKAPSPASGTPADGPSAQPKVQTPKPEPQAQRHQSRQAETPRQETQQQPSHTPERSFSQSPSDAQNAQARREMMEKLAREQHPAYARNAGQPQASAQQSQQSPEDRRDAAATREAQARENHPAHSSNTERAAQQPLQDRRNEAAAREIQARENHPGHAKNTEQAAQQPQRSSFTDKIRAGQPVPERKGSFTDRLANMRSNPQPSQDKTRSVRERDDEIER